MLEETHDEFAAWRGLLQPPDALPGQGLADREAAWDRLFERLNERPRRLFFSYRVAAACLLILLIPAARFFQERPATGPKHPFTQPIVPLAVSPKERPGTGAGRPAAVPAIDRASAKPAVDRPLVASSPAVQPTVPPPSRRPAHKPLLIHPASPEAVTRDTVFPMLAAEPPQILIQPQKPKKQWKVVDLNELDPRFRRPYNMAASQNARPPGLTINLSTENR